MKNGLNDQYKNVFEMIGLSDADCDKWIRDTFDTMFFDPVERFWHDTDEDAGCLVDTGNIDARTEGMSYGMMMCVQMDRQNLFDKLWQFSLRYMYMTEGRHAGYFAWSVSLDGRKNDFGPAPDGEEYFAAALLMADARWGKGKWDYAQWGRKILSHMVHEAELVKDGCAMFDEDNYLIRFVPQVKFSDPSYHLPHFYELFALLADEQDRPFFKKAAAASRDYIALCADPETGLSPEYSEYDGTPRLLFGKKEEFFSDAYRVAENIALHHLWCGEEERLSRIARNLQAFMTAHPECLEKACDLKGKCTDTEVMHPVGLLATVAVLSAITGDTQWLKKLREQPPRRGVRRYYDNCLYFFCILMLSGRYKVYLPEDCNERA